MGSDGGNELAKLLIVEDEALIALDLQFIVGASDPSHQVWTEASVADALLFRV